MLKVFLKLLKLPSEPFLRGIQENESYYFTVSPHV